MNHVQNADLDAKNRAAVYLRDAQKQAEEAQVAASQRQASDFQQVMLLRAMDHQHSLELRDAERRMALELKKLELERMQPLATGSALPSSPPFWESRWFVAALTVAVPVLLPFLFRLGQRSRRQVKRNFHRQLRRKNRRPLRIVYPAPRRLRHRRNRRWTWTRW